jgi:hypothetical protein
MRRHSAKRRCRAENYLAALATSFSAYVGRREVDIRSPFADEHAAVHFGTRGLDGRADAEESTIDFSAQ